MPNMNWSIRPVISQDIPALKEVIDSSELFPSEMLDDMIAGYLSPAESNDVWLTVEEAGTPIAVAYCAPEMMTEGTSNLYLIAVSKPYQGKGVGGAVMDHLEELLRQSGVRVLIVETSGLPDFERTRQFYLQKDYHQEAVIRDFYQEGEDKVVFWKKLLPK